MLGLRHKLSLASGGMLGLLIATGLLSLLLLNQYSATLERLFRENYDSVVFGQNMKDTITEMKDRAQTSLWSDSIAHLNDQTPSLVKKFEDNLAKEKGNITLPGEAAIAQQTQADWQVFRFHFQQFVGLPIAAEERRRLYQDNILTEAQAVRDSAQKIIDINLANIVSVDGQVRASADLARHALIGIILAGVFLGALFTYLIRHSIMKPLARLTQSVREIERGNLDLTVKVLARDELGLLAEAFNSMAARLREYRRSDRAKLFKMQRTTQLALNSFPDAVVIVGIDGKVELANEIAQEQFHMRPGADLANVPTPGLWTLFQDVFTTMRPVQPKGYRTAIQLFVGTAEHFYLPQAVPIISEDKSLVGVTIVLVDVTELRRLDEMKSNLVSVVSHELKTPLTSIRMSTHLLLEERVGSLNVKQTELLIAAREDAERLNAIIERLLDMGRIESGKGLMELLPVPVEALITGVIDRFAVAYRDSGVTLKTELASDLPEVLVDISRIDHVFSNLLDNALKYTPSGGVVTVRARTADDDTVVIDIADTGRGIPADALSRIFERFYRVPDQTKTKGAGLGLAIAKEIIEAHGGTIEVTSPPDVGSTFSFHLKKAPAYLDTPRGASH